MKTLFSLLFLLVSLFGSGSASAQNVSLSITFTGTGFGNVSSPSAPHFYSCFDTCTLTFVAGETATFAGQGGFASRFAGWGGACSGTGNCTIVMDSSKSLTATFTRIDPAFHDWNADRKPDIIWSNPASGTSYLWYMNGPAFVSDTFLAQNDPSWKIQGVADFNGDGQPDLVWRNALTGEARVWHMNGATAADEVFLFSAPPEWVIQGVADFNFNGRPDFLMRNTVTGAAFVWYFNDSSDMGGKFLFNVDPMWKVEAVGDMNGDGQPDLLFRNTDTGLAFAWFTQVRSDRSHADLAGSSAPIFGIDPVWEVAQMADWNGDGSPDLLFRNRDTGLVFVWYMNGTALAGSDYVTQIDPSWEIVPRR